LTINAAENRRQLSSCNRKSGAAERVSSFRGRILSVDVVIATQMIESWFFHDIEGIFRFLQVPNRERNPARFRTAAKFTDVDLAHLFYRYGKSYIKGKRVKNFIQSLDIAKILNRCNELGKGIDLIKKNARKNGIILQW
jgi:hypothetical protein